MALKLSWKNPNVVPNSVVIYRGDAPLDPAKLPAPLVELTAGELFWIDETAVFERTYYYILGVKTEHDLILTPNQKVVVADNRGVGPATLKFGNDALGYYGPINQSDFVSNLDIVAVAAKATGIPTDPVQVTWHKFARDGKVIYIPSRIFGNAKWVDLYHAGFVFGVDDTKHDETTPLTGLTATNQLRVVEFKGQRYKVRLMRMWSDGKDGDVSVWVSGDNDSLANIPVNEGSDLMYSLVNFVPVKQRLPNCGIEGDWTSIIGAPLAYGNASSEYLGMVLGQERQAGTGKVLARGRRSWDTGGYPTAHNKNDVAKHSPIGHDVLCAWLPVLELIPETSLTF
ncbi:MAG: hypothetical protein ACRDBQ_19045 [Shewanella sp.]